VEMTQTRDRTPYLIATRQLQAGEELFLRYSKRYWEAKQKADVTKRYLLQNETILQF
jgi:hypothetical protein